MERSAVASDRTAGVQAPTAHLPSLTSWRQPGSPPAGALTDEILVGALPCRAPGDAGQPRQAHGGDRRHQEPDAPETARPGPRPAPVREAAARSPGLDPQTRQGGAATARHPD